MHLCEMSAVALAAGLRDRRFSSAEIVRSCLERIAKLNSRYNAFITVAYQRALSEAGRADGAPSGDVGAGSLRGIPVAIKDTIDTAGIRTTHGSLLFAEHVPEQDDLLVARLRAAGAIVLGKTNTPELGFGAVTQNALIGATANPYDISRTSAGSSGGSAVAVALGMVPVAHGTDFAGSVRHPASFCGIVGFRPSMGRIPVFPKMPLSQSFVAHGFFSRCVEDAALLLAATAGRDDRDPLSLETASWGPAGVGTGRRPLRIGFSADLGFSPVDTRVEAVFSEAVEKLSRIYPETRPATLHLGDVRAPFQILRGALVRDQYAGLVERHGDELSETLRWNVGMGEGISAADYFEADRARSRIYLEMIRQFDHHDVLATVAAPVLPFPIGQSTVESINGRKLENKIDWFTLSAVVTLTGLPAISIPCGFSEEGLPVGLQLIARPHADAALLDCAFRLQEELGFRYKRPAVLDDD